MTTNLAQPTTLAPHVLEIVKTKPEIKEGDRHADARWLVAEHVNDQGMTVKTFAVVGVLHLKEHKLMIASLSNHDEIDRGNGMIATSFMIGGPSTRLATKPVARFSKKAMLETLDEALGSLRSGATYDEAKVTMIFGQSRPGARDWAVVEDATNSASLIATFATMQEAWDAVPGLLTRHETVRHRPDPGVQ